MEKLDDTESGSLVRAFEKAAADLLQESTQLASKDGQSRPPARRPWWHQLSWAQALATSSAALARSECAAESPQRSAQDLRGQLQETSPRKGSPRSLPRSPWSPPSPGRSPRRSPRNPSKSPQRNSPQRSAESREAPVLPVLGSASLETGTSSGSSCMIQEVGGTGDCKDDLANISPKGFGVSLSQDLVNFLLRRDGPQEGSLPSIPECRAGSGAGSSASTIGGTAPEDELSKDHVGAGDAAAVLPNSIAGSRTRPAGLHAAVNVEEPRREPSAPHGRLERARGGTPFQPESKRKQKDTRKNRRAPGADVVLSQPPEAAAAAAPDQEAVGAEKRNSAEAGSSPGRAGAGDQAAAVVRAGGAASKRQSESGGDLPPTQRGRRTILSSQAPSGLAALQRISQQDLTDASNGGMARQSQEGAEEPLPVITRAGRRLSSRLPYSDEFRYVVALARKHRVPIREVRERRHEFKLLNTTGGGCGYLNLEEFHKMVRQRFNIHASEPIPPRIVWGCESAEYGRFGFEDYLLWCRRTDYVEEQLVHDPKERALRQISREHGFACLDVEKVKAVFDTFDSDKSDAIDEEEFGNVICTLMKAGHPSDIGAKKLKRFWMEVDTDGSGEISFSEFLLWYFNFMRDDTGSR